MLERRVTTADCALGVAIPLSDDVFWAQAQDPERHELARMWAEQDLEIWQETVRSVREACDMARARGASVVLDLRLADLAELLRTRPVVAVLAHYRVTPTFALELSDGFVSHDSLLDVVPPGYDGVLDLSSCYGVDLAEAIKRKAPDSRIMLTKGGTSPVLVAWRFETVLEHLQRAPAPYTDLVVAITEALIRTRAPQRT